MPRNYGDGNQEDAALAAFGALIAEDGFRPAGKRAFRRDVEGDVTQNVRLAVSMKEGEWVTLRPFIGVRYREVHKVDARLLGHPSGTGPTWGRDLSMLMPRPIASKEHARRYGCFPAGFWSFRAAPEVQKKAKGMHDAVIEYGEPYLAEASDLQHFVAVDPETRFSLDEMKYRRYQIIAAKLAGNDARAADLLSRYSARPKHDPAWLSAAASFVA